MAGGREVVVEGVVGRVTHPGIRGDEHTPLSRVLKPGPPHLDSRVDRPSVRP